MVKTIFTWPYEGNTVKIAISNDWIETNMSYIGGIWTYVIDLAPGTYEYKFIVDDVWCFDIMNPVVNDNFNGKNNIIKVKDNNELTVVHISDTQSQLYDKMPDGDILIHSGDFSQKGHPNEYKKFDEWLGNQKYLHKFVVLGNNDLEYLMYNEKEHPFYEANKLLTNANVLNFDIVNVFGINIYGMDYYNDYFNTENNICHNFEPNNVDILVSHTSPYGVLDNYNGSHALFSKVSSIKPKYHLFGNSKQSYGNKKLNWGNNKETVFVNSFAVNKNNPFTLNNPQIVQLMV